MTEERLKEIKNHINFNLCFKTKKVIIEEYYERIIDEELELYNEVVRLREIRDKTKKYINKCQLGVDINDNPVMLIDQEEGKELLDILEENK